MVLNEGYDTIWLDCKSPSKDEMNFPALNG